MTGTDSELAVPPQRHPGQDDKLALGDGILAVLGGLTFLLALGLFSNPGMMGGLLLLVVLALLTGVATYTAVTGRSPSLITRVVGGVLAVLGVGVVVFGADHPLIIGVPLVAVAAGIGRTHSWRLRLMGLVGVVGLLVMVWVAA